MAILITKGEVKAKNKYYVKGDILDGILSKQDEKWLISQGFAEEVDINDAADIEKMTEKELRAFAALNNIDVTGAKGKAAVKAKIIEALMQQGNNDDDGGGDDDPDDSGDGDDA